MVAATVDLPDDLYARLERLARERGVSVSELMRQGAETLLREDRRPSGREPWRMPEPLDLGPLKPVPVGLWRELANETGSIVERAIAEGRLDELRDR